MAYEIKSLEWQADALHRNTQSAYTLLGWYFATETYWTRTGDSFRHECNSLSAAKAAAEAHWQERMRQGLVEVGA